MIVSSVMRDPHPTSCTPWSRRDFVTALTGATLVGGAGWSGRASANVDRVVAVPHMAFGSVVAAIGGNDVSVVLDAGLPLATMRLTMESGELEVAVTDRLLLKGTGPARRRYLDDARNAPKLGAAVRDGLRTHWPELGDSFAERHKAWSRDLVRNILRWTKELSGAGLRGKRVRDSEGWIYLLEWAGAEVTPDGGDPPAGLGSAPREPAAVSPGAYVDYIQALVDALR